MRKFGILLVSLVLFVGCTSKPMIQIENQGIPARYSSKTQLDSDQITRAIFAGCQAKGWEAKVIGPGLIEASITVRAHSVTVQIPYSSTSYSITYISSENLDYNNGNIHRSYNNWITYLSNAIQDELKRVAIAN